MSDREGKRVCLGAFAGAHGVRGEALIKTFTEKPENIAAYGPLETENADRRFTFTFIREAKPGMALIRSGDIATREDAMALKGVRLYVDRSALPEPEDNEFYMDDLAGLKVIGPEGEALGHVAAVYNFGAGDLLEIKNIPGVKGVRLIEFTIANAPDIELAAGVIRLSAEAAQRLNEASPGSPAQP